MYLLYLDESGTQTSARHFVLAGVSVYETNIQWASDRLDRIQSEYFPDMDENVQFHAAPLRAGDGQKVESPFDRLDRKARLEILNRLCAVAFGIYGTFFAVVIEKSYLSDRDDPYEQALEQVLSRFNHFIRRVNRSASNRDRGMVVIADSNFRKKLEPVANQFTSKGTQWGELRNIVDIPFFTLSKNSRLLQVADLVANSVYGRYENGYAEIFDRMLPKFDQDENGRMHGLLHLTNNRSACYLPCCLTLRLTQGENVR